MKSLFFKFKCECFQKSRAFKFRGATNVVFSVDKEAAAKRVVTHSSLKPNIMISKVNHAATKLRGIPAYVVVPENAPKCKIENVKRYGGKVILREANMQSRKETENKVVHETGAVLIPSSNDGRIIRKRTIEYAADIHSIFKARTLIKPYVHTTPVKSSETLNSMAGKTLFFKCECFQKSGAFKIRGATNAVFSVDKEAAAKGVVTHSRYYYIMSGVL